MSTMLAPSRPERIAPLVIDSAVAPGLSEYLTFAIGAEEYGVDILRVQEIRGYTGVTRLPESPAWVMGVINLRGAIVPVIDLRLRLARSTAIYDDNTVMVIVTVGERVVGMVVDAVSDVTRLGDEQVRPAPNLGGAIDQRVVRGIGTVADRMIILFDIDALLRSALDGASAAIDA